MHFNLSYVIIALGIGSCAPRALYFHETTKVGFAADYNTSDSQPLATSFGFKRRIVAVVPTQERIMPDGGSEANGTNRGEALSLVSKFNVRAGTAEGITITNNFASGMAARIMTYNGDSPESVSAMMHSAPIPVSATTGETETKKPAAEAVNERLAALLLKKTPPVTGGKRRRIEVDDDGNTRIENPPAREAAPNPNPNPHRRHIDVDAEGNARVADPALPEATPRLVPPATELLPEQ